MNPSSAKVPSLKKRALEVFFKDVCCKATPSMVEFVRDGFKQISWVLRADGDRFRDKCIQKLSKRYSLRYHGNGKSYYKPEEKDDESEQLPDPIVVLDCLLYEGCDLCSDLPLELPLLTLESLAQLLSVFSHRFPEVESLDLTFLPITTQKWATTSASPCNSLSKLDHLALTFEGKHYSESVWDHGKSQVFSIIGKVCPALSSLYVGGFAMRKMDVLRLIVVGELADIVFRQDSADATLSDDDDIDWSQESFLPGLRVPSEFLNPLCFTLKDFNYKEKPVINDSVRAFVMRHLPNSMNMPPDPDEEAARFIKLVYQAEKLLETRQLDFGEACRAAALRIGLTVNHLVPPPNLNYDDFLSLDFLECIPLDDADTLRSIGSLVPHLNNARFSADSDCIDELESILNGWPKVKRVTICNDKFNYKCLQPIINAFSSSLVFLRLKNCRCPIDLARLASCTVLEALVIHDCTVICEGNDPASRWTPQTFLPLLEMVETASCCLGVWAPLLETKSTLKRFSPSCCHIGTNAYNPRLEWSQVPKMWPNMETLWLEKCTGLTMMELSSLIPQWKNLKGIGVPKSIYTEDPSLTENIRKNFKKISKHFLMNSGRCRTGKHLCLYQEPRG